MKISWDAHKVFCQIEEWGIEEVGCICEQWENVYILANSGVARALLYITFFRVGLFFCMYNSRHVLGAFFKFYLLCSSL
jgi:hypothetical protein